MKELFYDKKGIYYRKNDFESNRTAIVFIHGLSASSIYWSEYEEIFKNKYNILFFDLRGHGKSLKYKKYSDYEIKNFSDDLFDLVTYLNIDKFVLVGHSFGTIVSLEFFANHGEKVSDLVLLSPRLSVAHGAKSLIMRGFLGIARIFELFPFKFREGSHVDFLRYKGTGDWNVRRLWADIRCTGLRAYLYSLRHTYTFDRDDIFEKIDIPTLIIHGDKDSYFPIKNSYIISRLIKNSEFVILNGADHIIVLNNTKEVLNAISGFVDKIEQKRYS